MKLTGKETNYYIARYNNSSEEHSVLRFNSYNGLFSAVNDFEQATKYKTFDEVKQIVELQNMLSKVMKQAYEYYAMKHDTESFRLDENGDVVTEEEVVEEQPAE